MCLRIFYNPCKDRLILDIKIMIAIINCEKYQNCYLLPLLRWDRA